MAQKFVHLHVHTEYSLLDGLPKIKKLITQVKEQDMDAVAITDHGVMYGAIEFYKKAKEEGVKPIIGMEAYTTLVDHKTKPQRGESKNNHLLLLAKNEEGYKNLMQIASIAHLEGFYYKPRIQRDLLKKYSKGLLVTSACPAGEVAQALINDDYEGARGVAQWFLDVFGEDYYLEVQRHEYDRHIDKVNLPDIREEMNKMIGYEKTINEGVLKLSRDLGIPIVATNDSHYLKEDDAEAQDVLICVATGKQVSDTKRIRFVDTPTFYLKTSQQMEELFSDLPEAIDNTRKVADKCDLEIFTLGKWFFPKFPLPAGKDAKEVLREQAFEKAEKMYGEVASEVEERLNHELGIIETKGYSPYFLIVADMVNWASKEGIVTNTRGSAAGSLVSYVMGITTVDPLKYYLPFERFLNPYRPSPPDIDLDIADDRRGEMIDYIVKTYGTESVAQICTFGRMLARAAVRDVARVLGYPYETGDRISKLIPPPKQGFPIDIPKALETTPGLKELYQGDTDAKKIMDLASHVEGSARHVSVHAAGVVVAPSKLTDFTPLQREPSGDKIITQYEMHASEDVGLIKFDILGIRNLSILGAAIKIVKRLRGVDIKLHKIPLDDAKTFEMLGRGDTMGTFQLGGSGMTRYLKDLKPTKIEDLMAMVALYRPGPMAVIPEYIERKRNPKLVKYLDPRMEKFLQASYGLIVYQDDLLFCAIDLAGYSWEEADKFRKAVGKKIPEEMAAQKDKFVKGIIDKGQTSEFAEKLWKLFEPFQSYGFNKAHAASYGVIAYYTAYLKANYPVEYMCALLTAESGDTEKITMAINECKQIGIKVLPPDINESRTGFTIIKDEDSLDGSAIRFGLSAIKNVGNAAIEAILAARGDDDFVSLPDFLTRIDSRKVNKKVLESLIKVGALSAFGNRAALLSSLEEVRAKVVRKDTPENQQGLFSDEEVKKASIQSAMLNEIPEFTEEELADLERQLLGLSLSGKSTSDMLAMFVPFASHKIQDIEGEVKSVKIAGVIREIRTVLTKKSGAEMAFAKMDDGTGSINLVIFPKIFGETKDIWVTNKPLLIEGKVDMRDDEYNLLVDSVWVEPGKEASDVVIRIPSTATAVQLKDLKKIFVDNPGSTGVSLLFEKDNSKVRTNLKISWGKGTSEQIGEIFRSGLS